MHPNLVRVLLAAAGGARPRFSRFRAGRAAAVLCVSVPARARSSQNSQPPNMCIPSLPKDIACIVIESARKKKESSSRARAAVFAGGGPKTKRLTPDFDRNRIHHDGPP
eukprot:1644564-Prymnesium_polylepis.1